MTAYPFQHQVGDLLGLGIYVEPEQEAVLDAPGCKVMAVGLLADPAAYEQPYWEKGQPVITPVFLETCEPTERIAPSLTLGKMLTEDPLLYPSAIGEIHEDTYGMYDDGIDDLHHARPVWDVWPITQQERKVLLDAHFAALDAACYLFLIDYFNHVNGNEDFYDAEHEAQVFSRVCDSDGSLKHPDEFSYNLVLPRDLAYKWERLKDLSLQSWSSLGLTLPDEFSESYFDPTYRNPSSGAAPWF